MDTRFCVMRLYPWGVDAVGVMGGDGTMREGVCGMLNRDEGDRRPIFVFPVGTGNNFARDLGVRTIEDMFAVIDRGTAHKVDAVKVTHPEGSTYSINCITWGEDDETRGYTPAA